MYNLTLVIVIATSPKTVLQNLDHVTVATSRELLMLQTFNPQIQSLQHKSQLIITHLKAPLHLRGATLHRNISTVRLMAPNTLLRRVAAGFAALRCDASLN